MYGKSVMRPEFIKKLALRVLNELKSKETIKPISGEAFEKARAKLESGLSRAIQSAPQGASITVEALHVANEAIKELEVIDKERALKITASFYARFKERIKESQRDAARKLEERGIQPGTPLWSREFSKLMEELLRGL